MDASDLSRWTRFAAKGGIGKCTALQDCVAQGVEDLMFLKDDEVVVLLQLPQEDQYLGYCEGVVGSFHGSAVRFHGKLKKPVFAKRQSTIGISPSPRSSPANSVGMAIASGSRQFTSPVVTPLAPPLSAASMSEGAPAENPPQSPRLSILVSSPPVVPSRATISHAHSRTPSITSSTSHFQSQTVVPALTPSHVRKSSAASSLSAYSAASHTPSRPHSSSTAESEGSESRSEVTRTQDVTVSSPPVPAAGSQVTPTLSDGASTHSSFRLPPTPALSTSFSLGKAPASLFQARARAGSEKLHTEPAEMRRRSGSENAVVNGWRGGEDEWDRRDTHEESGEGVLVETKRFRTPASDTDFECDSVYSDESGGGEAREDGRSKNGDTTREASARPPVSAGSRGILREDESDQDECGGGGRISITPNEDHLSDGGFGIGMTLLREDEHDQHIEEDGNDWDKADEETMIGHAVPPEQNVLALPPRRLRMRVMNPSSVSPSTTESESEGAEDTTIMPTPIQLRFRAARGLPPTSSADNVLTSGHAASASSSSLAFPPHAPIPTYASASTVETQHTRSVGATDDEPWESDADIYDDYRYSRYSRHSSGSPAQHGSRRASRGSTKSARSRASERPPLPDEDFWKKSTASAEGGDEGVVSQRKSLGSRCSSIEKISVGTGAERKSVPSTEQPSIVPAPVSPPTPFSRGADVALTSGVIVDASHRKESCTPPPQDGDVIMPATPGAASVGMTSLMSPLTRAFRRSDDSQYSSGSVDNVDDDHDQAEEHKAATPILASRRLPSPGSDGGKQTDRQRSRSKSPALASYIRDKIENERRAKGPIRESAGSVRLTVVTARTDDEPNVVVFNDSPLSNDSRGSFSSSDNPHIRVGSPQSYTNSAPPSPLNPGYPPSPPTMPSFAPTLPLSISKSPMPSPSAPRQPISPPAIPFTGVPPPGCPPAHMQYAQHSVQAQPASLQQQQQQRSAQGIVPPSESLHSALRMAGQQRANTIHGRTQADLLTATGPVPISFLLPGMMPPPSPTGFKQGPVSRPQLAAPQVPYGHLPLNPQHQTQDPLLESHSLVISPPSTPAKASPSHNAEASPGMRRPMTAPAPGSPVNVYPTSNPASSTSRMNPLQVVQSSARAAVTPPPASPSAATPLPRANFVPKVGQVRPRSRSFSGFNSETSEKVSHSTSKRSQEEGFQPLRTSSISPRPGSPSLRPATTPSSQVTGPMRGKAGQAPRPSHVPSPLSLPPTTNNSQPPTAKSPFAFHSASPPITRVAPAAIKVPDVPDTQPKRGALRQTSFHVGGRFGPQSVSNPTTSSVTFPPQRRNSGPSTASAPPLEEDSSPLNPPPTHKSPTTRPSHDSDRNHYPSNQSETTPPPSSNSPSSSPMIRNGSLRSKISISALRVKGASRSVRDGVSEAPTTGPATPLTDEETVQIKDLEFELVRPALPRASSDLHRGEEIVDSKDVTSIRTADLRQDSSSVRSGTLSPGGRSPSSDFRPAGGMNASPDSFVGHRKGKGVEPNNSVQAHRDRELKWISTMTSSDAAQARKSKKIRKLLVEGVPSSVRYLVWAHISNSGSKKMPNVYAQLCKRRPALAHDIERDVELSFPEHPHLRDAKGPLVSVLFAYIAMVPDLRYHRGLAIIAGHLLLQSPEEDAFWTFLAMMDSHLRPYFMPTSPQMGIDTNLFVKALEASDPQLARRVFTELNVRPHELCGVWFSSVFAGTLPLEHLHRVWDLFFYEGVPFLFRIGLTIMSLSRRYLLEFPKGPPTSYTAYLLRPPPDALPADPEQFISQALAVKLKDEDIRKMRQKMEAAVKQQQQRAPRLSTSQPSRPHLQDVRVRVS